LHFGHAKQTVLQTWRAPDFAGIEVAEFGHLKGTARREGTTKSNHLQTGNPRGLAGSAR